MYTYTHWFGSSLLGKIINSFQLHIATSLFYSILDLWITFDESMFTFNCLSFFSCCLLFITITIHHFDCDEQLATKNIWLCLIFLTQTHTFCVHATLRIMAFWMLCVSYAWFVHCCCVPFVYGWSWKNVMCWTKRYAKNNNNNRSSKTAKNETQKNFLNAAIVSVWHSSVVCLCARKCFDKTKWKISREIQSRVNAVVRIMLDVSQWVQFMAHSSNFLDGIRACCVVPSSLEININ